MGNNSQGNFEQGLLDLSVELSTSDVTAGNEFAIFVLVKNPFSRPVWIREVNVSLPSELKRVDEERIRAKLREEAEDKRKEAEQKADSDRTELKNKVDDLQTQIGELTEALSSNNSTELSAITSRFEIDLRRFQDRIRSLGVGMSSVQVYAGAEVNKIKIGSQASDVQVYAVEDGRPAKVNQLEIYEPWLIFEEQAQTRTIKLKSSLPDNTSLQPGSTAVYTVILNVKRSLVFTPSKYRLQFYVNYGFDSEQPNQVNEYRINEMIFTNTIAHSLPIRPSVYSVITGALIGGTIGAFARLLQTTSSFTIQNSVVTLILSVILATMAVIFMARKSDTQSFVSVEDFWGGILIGFLVGYTGTSFFESITGLSISTP